MAKEYKWIIRDLKISKSLNGLKDVVKKVYYRRTVTEIIDGKEFVGDFFGEFNLPPADPNNYTDFGNLTYSEICLWLESILPVDFIKSRIDGIIDIKIKNNHDNPSVLPNDIKQDNNIGNFNGQIG